jgi:hypothetical protein
MLGGVPQAWRGSRVRCDLARRGQVCPRAETLFSFITHRSRVVLHDPLWLHSSFSIQLILINGIEDFEARMKKDGKEESAAENISGEGGAAPQAGSEQRGARVEVTDKNVLCLYANFCRVTGTPEELILDFGLNAQPFGVPTEPVEVKQRIVTNYFTAKRMLQALMMSVQRHEQAFGVLETDVQKRVVGRPPARAGT